MAFDPNRDHRGGIIGGVIVMVIGVGLLFDHLGLLNFSHFYRFWPMILIIIGLFKILNRPERVKGVILIVIGTLLQLDQLNIAHVRWGELWPLLIIGAGLSIVWRTLDSRRNPAGTGDPRTTLNEMAIFGGVVRRITTKNFQGGKIHATFGGVEIDLRDADMEADEAVLEINAVFGGVEITVPTNWVVSSRGQGIFGGYEDSTHLRQPENVTGMRQKTLLIQGVAVFGGVEIKN